MICLCGSEALTSGGRRVNAGAPNEHYYRYHRCSDANCKQKYFVTVEVRVEFLEHLSEVLKKATK